MSESEEKDGAATRCASHCYAVAEGFPLTQVGEWERYDRAVFFAKLSKKVAVFTQDWAAWEHTAASAGIDGRSTNDTERQPKHSDHIDI